MDNIINPEVKENQHRLSRVEGQIEEIKRIAGDTSRQTIWQFIAFAAVMAGILIGSSIFQTEALRRETAARLEAINQRFEGVNDRFERVEKRLEKIEKAIEELTLEIRASRRRNGASNPAKHDSTSQRPAQNVKSEAVASHSK